MISSESAPSASRRHLDALTGIRGLAAWLVVLYHLRASMKLLLPDWALSCLAKGYLAVDLFFMLSGFVLWYNYAERLRECNVRAVADFYWRRIARIWPLHIVILCGFILFAMRSHGTAVENHIYSYKALPLHVFLMQGWGWTDALAWNSPAWSISTELAAYLVFPIVAGFTGSRRLSPTLLVCLAIGLLIALHLLFAVNGWTKLGGDISHLGLWRCLLEFSLGNLICIAWQRYGSVKHAIVIAVSLFGCALGIGLACGLPETMFVPVALASGLFALASSRGILLRIFSARAMTYLGEISYSTYLAHVYLFTVFKLIFVDESKQINWLEFGAFLALLLASSALLHRWVEKPAQHWLNRNKPRVRALTA